MFPQNVFLFFFVLEKTAAVSDSLGELKYG